MAREKVLTSTTIELPFYFYDRIDGETLVEVSEPKLKIFDSKRVLLETIDITSDRISAGYYLCFVQVPEHTPYIYVEVSALNGGISDIKREKIETCFSYDDMNTGNAPLITEGENCYITYENALDIIPNLFQVEPWFSASEDNRIRALILATKHIDSLILKGQKLSVDQKLAFPRMIRNLNKVNTDTELLADVVVNDIIKEATVLEAIAILSQEFQTRENLIHQGVTNFSIGDIRETLVNKGKKLYSIEAQNLLKSYISGSVSIKL
jgi:hypothetical protein